MGGGLELALIAAAALAGVTGTWSPCGFSMIETIGPVGHTGGRATTLAACITFTIGALAGGVATFGALAVAGSIVHGADQRLAYAAAAAVALGAAALELRGARIVPQVRRQLPEHWRRAMPMPLAAGLYGGLLGLGFTTFVLSFGVFALAGICFALGEPEAGLAVGLAFGACRALPVVLTAPVADRAIGIRVTELMAERSAIYRGFRVGDAATLVWVAAAVAVAAPASASRTVAPAGADPAAGPGELAFELAGGEGRLRRDGGQVALPGTDPALGGGRIAVLQGGEIVLIRAADLAEIGRIPAPDADAVAVGRRWVAWRAGRGGGDAIFARRVADPARPGRVRALARSRGDSQLGRPSLDGNRLVYARAGTARNLIVMRRLGGGRDGNRDRAQAAKPKRRKAVLLRSRVDGISNPALRGDELLYVRHTRHGDKLKLLDLGGRGNAKGRTLLTQRRGTLWSTALTAKRAYVTQVRGTGPRQRILSTGR